MLDLEPLYRLVSLLPFECLQAGFMQQALVALILLAPMAATMGVQVVSFRMAFFSDAISHSAFAGVALGLIFSINPHVAMPVFGILVGLGIMAVQRNSALSSDTIIGVFFSAVMAFGLAVVSRDNAVARDLQQFLYGDILTITETDIRWLIGLFFALAAFQIWGYNRLLYIGLNSVVAKAHRINVFFWQYLFAGLLALVVMFSVWAVGVLLVTALLIVPAATARNLARTAGGMFWWSILVSVTSAVAGLVLSAQEWAGTATGATVVLVSCGWFLLSAVLAAIRERDGASNAFVKARNLFASPATRLASNTKAPSSGSRNRALFDAPDGNVPFTGGRQASRRKFGGRTPVSQSYRNAFSTIPSSRTSMGKARGTFLFREIPPIITFC